jgi:uncharacterized membrane protein
MDNQQIQVSASQAVMYSGPLPPAAEFAGYDKALSGAAERILVMAEKEVENRHTIQNKLIKISSLGQILGFLIAIIGLGAVFVSLFLNQPLGSIAPAIVALTGLAAIFVGKNSK